MRLGTIGFSVAAGLAVWLLRWRSLVLLVRENESEAQQHFDSLSDSYDQEIPSYIRDRLLERKVGLICSALEQNGIVGSCRGFDLGCGHGWYAIRMAQRGFTMLGGDLSKGQIEQARKIGSEEGVAVGWTVLDGNSLPVPDNSQDFVYSINVLHHVIEPAVRSRLIADIVRALRPNGIFVLHEINTRNPLFRFYISYLFPLIRRIDDGTERWIKPHHPPRVSNAAWDAKPYYFTFLPDFAPAPLVRLLAPLEARLEASRLRFWSAHYQLILRKEA